MTSSTSLRSMPRLVGRVLLWIGVFTLLVVVGLTGVAAWLWSRTQQTNVGELSFANPLKIPPLLEPRIDAGGRKIFDLRLQAGTSELLPGKTTQTWGANGSYLGPTLRASNGDRVAINVTNELPEPTSIHWHGMHLPPEADGGPHQMINPGGTWSPGWTIDQPAATLWYHPHLHGLTEDHVYRGLAGLFLLDDPQASAMPLPNRYGVDDIPLIIQDMQFDDHGRLEVGDSLFSSIGRLGSEILVNGTHDPHLDISSQRVRFRLLNASTARSYNLGFADNRPFHLIGSDGGLLAEANRVTRVQLSPGERAEIVVEFASNDRPVLRSYEVDLGLDGFQARFAGADDRFDLLQMRAAAELMPAPPLPDRLVDHERLAEADAIHVRRFELNGSSRINDKKMNMTRIDETVTVDTTELWEVTNQSGNPHNFHVHDVQVQIVNYAGAAPPPALAGGKDTIFLPPHATVQFLIRFTDYTSSTWPYMFHCHLLRHEDNGMMGQFLVLPAEQAPVNPPKASTHSDNSGSYGSGPPP
jgi:blue copper oxidase